MDIKIEIKEEAPLSEVTSCTERGFSQDLTMKLNNGAAVCNTVYEMETKTEIKEEAIVSDFSPQNHLQHFSENPVMKINETETKTETGGQNSQFSPPVSGVHVATLNPCNEVSKLDTKIEVKEELWWQEQTSTEAPCVDNSTKDLVSEKLTSTESIRLCMKAVAGDSCSKSAFPSCEVSGRRRSFSNGEDYPDKFESKETNVTEMPSAAEHFDSEETNKYSDVGEMYTRTLYLKHKNLIHKGERLHKCNICEKKFTQLSNLKTHNLIHEGKKAHHCKACDKSFTQLSHLKRHNLIHEGKKPHQCKVCSKKFTQLSHLKLHNLTHGGDRPHQCKTCDKSFIQLSQLKIHNLTQEGKKPHMCKSCGKTFAELSNLKRHYLIHEGKKPHHCRNCDKSFSRLSSLERHNLIHEGKRPHHCKVCDKNFSDLSNLKRHNLIHEGKKPYQCKTCDKGFTQLSHLKRHNMIHRTHKMK